MTALVQLQKVSRVYDGGSETVALDAVNLIVQRGEFTAIMGPSGSGKSTLLNLIAGLDRPTSGTVTVAGVDVGASGQSALAKFRRVSVGFVFQFFNLLGTMTVAENVAVPAELAGRPRAVVRERVASVLEDLGIADLAHKYPDSLSGGQKQRVSLGRALVNEPALLLADEPTGALDSRSGQQVMDLVAALNEHGQTVLFVTHDHQLATAYGRRIVTLRDGRIADDTMLDSRRAVPLGELIGWNHEGR
ncbi:ABC transporter ATP-binding protein [Sinomonas sp. R1AF57]|uniref:ABC transporter ATP-binding protein n=1 Tax=Sinomonas sp. R1AF57 TaxID=2020377 RepID=UPI001C9BCB92|nr:ABC transporter ATP-binding protein [Sinomonas sp. R1AF57]